MSRNVRRSRIWRMFSRNLRVFPMNKPSSERTIDQQNSNYELLDQPSNLHDVINIFRSHLESLIADPRHLDTVRKSVSFEVCLQCIAYRTSVCQYAIDFQSSYLKNTTDLVRLGFRYLDRDLKDENSSCEKRMSDDDAEKAELTKLLDQARQLGLGQEVEAITRACKFNLDLRKLMSLSDGDEDSGRWDQVLINLAEFINLLDQRNKTWPPWSDLSQSCQQIMEPVELYQHDDRHDDVWLFLLHLQRVSYMFLQAHATAACKYVKFHSRFLDAELCRMCSFITDRTDKSYLQAVGSLSPPQANSPLQAVGSLMAATDVDFCKISIKLLSDFRSTLITHRFGLRLYRMCLRENHRELADLALKMRFADNPDKQQVIDLLKQLLIILQYNDRQATDRVLLNAAHNDDVTGEYELPQFLDVVEETPQNKPLWVDGFQQSNLEIEQETSASFNSGATTSPKPSSSNVREWSSKVRQLEALEQCTASLEPSSNQAVARLFTKNNTIRDNDTCIIPFSYISVDVASPVTLKCGSDHERITNIATDVPYHCRVLTYHPVSDEWTVRSDMCRITGPLAVEQAGVTCVPFIGDCGEYLKNDSVVFKIHKHLSSNPLRQYMADVRTQSIALWYVNRFRKMTKHKFGVLDMLHSDCVIVYQDSHCDTILELMTREKHHRPSGSAVKFDKYTNNLSYSNKNVNTELLTAFSHFTHHDSGETVMVTDLQGWVGWDDVRNNISYTLTDPVIHCPEQHYKFGGTNLKHLGIQKFFRDVHPTCNHICESLKLTRSKSQINPEPDTTGKPETGELEKRRSLSERGLSRPVGNERTGTV